MTETIIAEGVVHEVPDDLRRALLATPHALERWNKLTPLARNEWICWATIVKKPETRAEHIERLCVQLLEGKRRPCCWAGLSASPGEREKMVSCGGLRCGYGARVSILPVRCYPGQPMGRCIGFVVGDDTNFIRKYKN